MKLTEIQEAWLVSLETSPPERQATGFLGKKNEDGSYVACCLGELHIIGCKMKGLPSPFECSGSLRSKDSDFSLIDSCKDYYLISENGGLRKPIETKGYIYGSLTEMNDSGMTWKQIATYIRSNHENVFTNIS